MRGLKIMLNINTIFIKICDRLNLSTTLYQDLEKRYKSVSEYLSSCNKLEDIKVYSQGSVAIGTTIKPIAQEEYDLDFVCEKNMNPFDLFQLIKDNLKNNEQYKNIVEEKKRCVRINYKRNFHLDILPACPVKNNSSQTGILIPDKELKRLLPSDPKGYISWFKNKSSSQIRADKVIEPLPQYQNTLQKSNLQYTVQLMKRHRDIFFQDQSDQSPLSIILTTLCGEYYIDQQNILDSMKHVINTIITKDTKEVYNPVNPEELFSEKWNESPELYNKFKCWVKTLEADLESLKEEENMKEILLRMFGENITQPILDELEKRESIYSNRKRLSISSSGILSSSKSNPVPRNTFYGQEEKVCSSDKLKSNG